MHVSLFCFSSFICENYFCTHYIFGILRDESQVTVDPEIWKATHFEKQCNHQRILATFPLWSL